MNLTDEQTEAVVHFRMGQALRVEAGAGTGKTSTLRAMGRSTKRYGTYVAFNKMVVVDATAAMPDNISCSTMHSLAFRAVGRKFAHRLDSPRMRSAEVAKRLSLGHITVRYGSQSKVLQAGYLAGLVNRTIRAFCQSGDPDPAPEHVPYIDGIDVPGPLGQRGWANNLAVRAHIAPAVEKAWADLTDPAGQLRFDHSAYLKIWQLGRPEIDGDFILLDECQPPGTLVKTPTGDRPIEHLRVGDKVIAYSQSAVALNNRGNQITGVSARPFDGSLVTVKTDAHVSRYTPNHVCIAKIGAAFYGKTVVYVMRRGGQFRVGTTSAHHGSSRSATAGVRGRLFEEKGDSAWVLATFDDKKDALMEEQFVSSAYGLPQVRFEGARFGQADHDRVENFWLRFGDNTDAGLAALAAYGRDVRYPLINRDRRYLLYARATEVRACNLLDGMLVLDHDRYEADGGRGRSPDSWVPISVGREPYAGPVFSLDVAVNHSYIADGLVTHNCQDQSAVMLAVMLQQAQQLIAVGDSCQAIYGWLGAVNALERIPTGATAYLTRSWRFGPALADVANTVLARLNAKLRLTGCDERTEVRRLAGLPDALLCRSNAEAIRQVLSHQAAGIKVHLVGTAGKQVVQFAEAAQELKAGRWCSLPELACFQSWGEVVAYVENDIEGGELALMVGLVEEFGVDTIKQALTFMPSEDAAQMVISTAHASKGREWGTVRLASDFPDPEGDNAHEELRLLYVAATRAWRVLDLTQCSPLVDLLDGNLEPLAL